MSEPLLQISRKQAFTFAGFLVLYEFLTYVANDMIMPGMIAVVHTFNAPESSVPTSLTAYILGGASLQLILGPLSDRYGRRPVMLRGALLFLIFTLLIACTQTMDQFLIARFFQGMGLCFIGVIGYTTLQEAFSEIDAIRLIALLANTATIAPLLGPLLGAVFISWFDWRIIFLTIGCFALVALWGLWRFMPETVGVVKRDGSVNHPVSLAPKVIAKNYRNLLKDACFLIGSFSIALMNIPCLAWLAISPILLISDEGLSVITYGLCQIPVFGLLIIGNFILRILTNRMELEKIILLGSLITLAGLGIIPLCMWIMGTSWQWLIPGLSIYSLGLGISGGPLNRRVLFSTPVSKGTASALLSIILMSGIAAGIELAKYVYEFSRHDITAFVSFLVYAGIVYLGFLLGFRVLYGKRVIEGKP